MKPRRWPPLFAVLALLLVALGVSQPILGAVETEPNPAELPIGELFHWLNFLLVLALGAYGIKKGILPALRQRSKQIGQAIAEAAALKAEAERQLRRAEDALGNLEKEVAELRAAAQRESSAEAERIMALARQEAEKIERAARAEIEAAMWAVRMELKAAAARVAVERAGALIRQRMTPDGQAWLFRRFVEDLSRSAH